MKTPEPKIPLTYRSLAGVVAAAIALGAAGIGVTGLFARENLLRPADSRQVERLDDRIRDLAAKVDNQNAQIAALSAVLGALKETVNDLKLDLRRP